ncbi:MAG: hypothetical protein ACFB6S_06560 [Geminicoccaceae bacterium]
MAYDPSGLSALSYANGFTLWHYRTTDTAGAVSATGYFAAAVAMMRVGDFILVNADTDGTPESGVMVVISNDGSTIDAANMVQFNLSNAS